jgi:hypothetical protein
MDEFNDPWFTACIRIVRSAEQNARKYLPPPVDEWEKWCREMELIEVCPMPYFPRYHGSLTFGTGSGFSHETEIETAWRHASNRMKRTSELWERHANSIADKWGHWCTNRAVSQSGGRLKDW